MRFSEVRAPGVALAVLVPTVATALLFATVPTPGAAQERATPCFCTLVKAELTDGSMVRGLALLPVTDSLHLLVRRRPRVIHQYGRHDVALLFEKTGSHAARGFLIGSATGALTTFVANVQTCNGFDSPVDGCATTHPFAVLSMVGGAMMGGIVGVVVGHFVPKWAPRDFE